jgi:hypothetical protein
VHQILDSLWLSSFEQVSQVPDRETAWMTKVFSMFETNRMTTSLLVNRGVPDEESGKQSSGPLRHDGDMAVRVQQFPAVRIDHQCSCEGNIGKHRLGAYSDFGHHLLFWARYGDPEGNCIIFLSGLFLVTKRSTSYSSMKLLIQIVVDMHHTAFVYTTVLQEIVIVAEPLLLTASVAKSWKEA